MNAAICEASFSARIYALLVVCALAYIATAAGLRIRSGFIRRGIARRVRDGSIQWGCQARELNSLGLRGTSGILSLTPMRLLRLDPDRPSGERGAEIETWPLDSVRIEFGRRRLDITGVTYRICRITSLDDGSIGRFGCVSLTGRFEA